MEWFKEGERNTKFFHTIIKGRRSRMRINRIQTEQWEWLEEQEAIAEAAVDFYIRQFTKQTYSEDFEMLIELPIVINDDKNEELQRLPSIEEVRSAVMGLNKNSAGGPDGMTGAFFQQTWEIVGNDIHNMVKAFFCGAELPRYITHTNLVLLPKKSVINIFSDLRPISLSNFMNKVFSRIIHKRIKSVLPLIISPE